MTESVLLSVQDLSVSYGAIEALDKVSFEVRRGEIVTLIGANGAGKSTTLRAISGLLKPLGGSIKYKGSVELGRMKAHEIVRQRISQVPEGRGIFLNLTVEENLDLGAWAMPSKTSYNDDLAYAFELFPRLKERRRQNAGTLSGGEQQMLAIARALMGHPELLLLDEPSLGLAPQIIEQIFEIVQKINSEGMTVLLVEQNALQALEVAHHGLVLETGSIVSRGTARELLESDVIRQAYLGG